MAKINSLITCRNNHFRCSVFLILGIFISPMIATAQVLPPAGQSGIIEKSLRDSQPQFQPPPEEEVPQIQIQDSRQVKDAGAGIGIVIRKIVTEGNTLIDDETLAPLVDVGEEGLEVTLGILALIANEVTAFLRRAGIFSH